eukprot:9771860-Ditylum_brightwellii.AAC.1
MSSMIAKNVAMEKKIVFEHTLQLNKEIRVKKQRLKLFNELKDHCGCNKSVKTMTDECKTYLDDIDVESSNDLQEYLLHDILETDHNILKRLKMKKQQEIRMEEL